jgi:ATP:ADP antiporter, AAA family
MQQRIESGLRGAVAAATLGAGALVAQQVAGRATRDALFLSSFHVASLPLAMIASALASAASVLAFSAALSRRSPARVLPVVVAAATVLLVGEWGLSLVAPRATALAVYLHMAVFGATVLSGFWSLVNERFDPYTAKRVMGPIGLGAALGGVLGGALAWAAAGLVPVAAMVLVMATFNVVALLAIDRLLATAPRLPPRAPSEDAPTGPLGALRLLRQAPYLRDLAVVVALGAAIETIVDYIVNAQAAATFASGPPLMSFFALFNTAMGLVGLLLQTTLTRSALEGLGLAGTVALRPGVVAAAALAGTVDPRLWSALFARGLHGALSNSLFRSAYELLYTPLPERQKRPAKSIVDVGFDRLGTVAAGVFTLAAAWALGIRAPRFLFAATAAIALVTLGVSRRLHRGYVTALEESLRSGLIRLEEGDVMDSTTLATLAHTSLTLDRRALLQEVAALRGGSTVPAAAASTGEDPVVQVVAGLRSEDPDAIRWALRRLPDLPAVVTGHAVPLLARTDLYLDVQRALRMAAPRATGQIVDALLDPSLPAAARRRIPRVLRGCPADRAAAGLVQALDDGDFEVRRQSAQALDRMIEHDAALRPPREVAFGAAIRELRRGAAAWRADVGDAATPEDASPGPDAPPLTAEERGLAHVFTLLALALDREPAQIAHRAVRGADPALRGTALEYLENVLPEDVRAALWPYLGVRARRERPARPAQEVVQELLRRKPSG